MALPQTRPLRSSDLTPRPWSLPAAAQRQPVQQAQQLPQRPWPLPLDAVVSTATSSSSLTGASGSGSFGSSPAALPTDALHVYAYGIDEDDVAAAIDSMKLGEALWLTRQIHDSDAILALRSKVKQVSQSAASAWISVAATSLIPASTHQNAECPWPLTHCSWDLSEDMFKFAQGDWVRTVAKQEGIPVFVVKSAGRANLVRALRTLLGIDPSAGTLFGGGQQADDSWAQPTGGGGVVSRVRCILQAAATRTSCVCPVMIDFIRRPLPPSMALCGCSSCRPSANLQTLRHSRLVRSLTSLLQTHLNATVLHSRRQRRMLPRLLRRRVWRWRRSCSRGSRPSSCCPARPPSLSSRWRWSPASMASASRSPAPHPTCGCAFCLRPRVSPADDMTPEMANVRWRCDSIGREGSRAKDSELQY